MTKQKTNHSATHCIYPGEYIPAPLKLTELMAELQIPHEGETTPLVNVLERADMFIIELAAPGLKNRDFYVTIHDNILSISVLHKETANAKKLYRQHEFNYSCFQRKITLPQNVDADFISAVYMDGILCVKLPKSKKAVINQMERVIIY